MFGSHFLYASLWNLSNPIPLLSDILSNLTTHEVQPLCNLTTSWSDNLLKFHWVIREVSLYCLHVAGASCHLLTTHLASSIIKSTLSLCYAWDWHPLLCGSITVPVLPWYLWYIMYRDISTDDTIHWASFMSWYRYQSLVGCPEEAAMLVGAFDLEHSIVVS